MGFSNNEVDTSLKTSNDDNGARKAAILLSLLDSKTVGVLLGMFDPCVAAEIAEEAKRVTPERISLHEIENIVQEFVDSFFDSDKQLADALIGEAKQTLGRREPVELANQEKIELGVIVDALLRERPTTIAAILTAFPPDRRADIIGCMSKTLGGAVKKIIAEYESMREPSIKERAAKLANAFWNDLIS